MKQTLILLAVVLTIGLFSNTNVYGEKSAQADTSKSSDWDALFDNDRPDRDAQRPQGQRGQRGEGFDRGSRRSPGREGSPHGRRGPGSPGGYGDRVEPQALLDFLHEHEPQLAQKLEDLKDEDSRKARRMVQRLSQLYAPVIRQMKREPEMGQLSLKRVRAQLKIKNQLRQSKKNGATLDTGKLRSNVEVIFDVIIAQEEFRNQKMTERMAKWKDSEDRQKGKGKGQGQGQGQGKVGKGKGQGQGQGKVGKGKGQGQGQGQGKAGKGKAGKGQGKGKAGKGQNRRWDGKDHMKDFQASIAAWKENKAKIVNQQVKRLKNDVRPFPWGRY